MEKIEFEDAYEGVLNAYYNLLEAERKENGKLEDVKSIVRGDRSKPTPKPPTIWIFPVTSTNNQSFSRMEDWELPVQLIAITKNADPMEGYYESFKLAARARSVILKNRKLGLNYVRDTISKSFEPTSVPNNRKNLYAHFALLFTHFNVLE